MHGLQLSRVRIVLPTLRQLATQQDGLVLTGKLDQMQYHGPSDLIAAAAEDPYVPAHLKNRAFGDNLVVR